MRDVTRQLILVVLVLAINLFLPSEGHADRLPSGTRITNKARVNYLNPETFVAVDLWSNEVAVVVGEADGLELLRDQATKVAPGGTFTLLHKLKNTGNISRDITVFVEQLSGGSFDITDLFVTVDANGNGQLDAGEPSYAGTFSLPVAAGETVNLIVSGRAPLFDPQTMSPFSEEGTQQPASTLPTAQIRLHASIDGTGLAVFNTDTLTLESGLLQIYKSVDRTTAVRGDIVNYTLTGENSGLADLTPVNVRVDGSLKSFVLIRDPMPANLVLVDVPRANGATVLYHRAGAGEHYYTETPGDLSEVDAVAWGFRRLQAGQHFVITFRARLGPAAMGVIENIAYGFTGEGGVTRSTASNMAEFAVPGSGSEISYYVNDWFERIAPASRLGSDLWVQVVAGACNLSSSVVDKVSIEITSKLTGDREVYIGVETGINTGVFRIIGGVPTEEAPTRKGDGILQTQAGDELTAKIEDCGGVSVTATTMIVINSMGVIFDSRTGDPVAGATVRLIDVTGEGNGGNSGGLATVLGEDGLENIPALQITGPDGGYRFPIVEGSRYRIEVEPPENYEFPSMRPQGALPPGHLIDHDGSYGRDFRVESDSSTIRWDVPLDTTSGAGFMLEKEASQNWIEVGESVIYTLRVKNTTGARLNAVTIEDQLPVGFRFARGTTRREAFRVDDPEMIGGSHLRFPVGMLDDGETVTFTYRVRVEVNAHHGDGINRAQAVSMGPPILRSNRAQAQVRMRAGVFDERGIIIGRVFVDLDGDGVKTEGEPGVPGVRLVLEDGTWVITDAEGLYSIYGQRPITHVLKVDPHTLPPGAVLSAFSPRHARDGGSRFVDLKRGELHKANFALIDPTPELLEAVKVRREQSGIFRPEIESALLPTLTPDGQQILPYDVMARDAAGVIGGGQMPPHFENVLPSDTLGAGNSNLPSRPVSAVPQVDLEQVLEEESDPELGFIDLKDGDILPFRQATIRIKGHVESRLGLTVNGEEAPENRIGKRVQKQEPPVQGIEYVALTLQAGENELVLTEFDPWGNARDSRTITLIAPDQAAQFRIEFSDRQPMADGRTPVEVSVFLEDKNGVPVTSRTAVTLESSLGRWDVEDVDLREDGVQVFLDDGMGTFHLLPPIEAGLARIVISSGQIREERELSFLPELRPMIVSGILDGRVSLNGANRGSILPIGAGDAFEEELRDFANSGDGTASGRAAFYLKGKIKGDALLTIAYDSDKRKEDVELFRDIDPDEFYPVYGDSSIRGFDAQSTGNLYVRIDKNQSYFLLGDFNTRSKTEVRELGNYNRSFNGVEGHWENSRLRANAWASDASTKQVILDLRANGTSGPFFFNQGFAVPNSETVEIVTRDRNQQSQVLSVEQLARFSGYDFEPFSGRLLLRRPVSSFDSNMNPLYIRVTYEVEKYGERFWVYGGDVQVTYEVEKYGERFWVYGGDVQVKVTERIEIGGSAVKDEDAFDPYSLQSGNATVRLGKGTYLIGEVARSESLEHGDGQARRAELRHESGKTEARIFYGESDDTFDNPNSMLSSGRDEGGAKVTHRINERNRVIAEGIYTDDAMSGMKREGVRADLEHTLPNQVRLTAGGRVSEEELGATTGGTPTGPSDVRSARVRIDTPVPGKPNMTVFGEYEQDVRYSENRVLAAGGDYQVSTKTRLYGRHEFISSLGSQFEINRGFESNRTLIGVESEYMKDGQLFNEYRAGNSMGTERAESSTGLRNGWNLAPGVRMNTTFERITPFSGESTNESTAATGAIEYTAHPDWKGTARLEVRFADSADNLLNTLGVARRLNDNWTALGRTALYHQKNKTADSNNVFQARVLGGLAWRQKEIDRWNGLFRYEYRVEDGSPRFEPADLWRDVHIFSSSVNYQPSRQWIFSGRLATKFVREDFGFGDESSYNAHLLSGRVLHELNEHWDIGLNVSALFSGEIENVTYALGPEIGYSFHKNMRLGIGYNIIGFRDQDFENGTDQGVFLTFRVKIDENFLKWADFSRKGDS